MNEAVRSARKPVIRYHEARTLAFQGWMERCQWLAREDKPEEARELAAKLRQCTPAKRCRSGACPKCATRVQYFLAMAIEARAAKAEGKLFVLTVVPSSSVTPVGGLAEFSHQNHVRRLKDALKQTEIRWLVGGTDFSLNEDKEKQFDPYWCPHLFGIGEADDLRTVREQLGMRFTGKPPIFRPVKLVEWDGAKNALVYALKTAFYRRLSLAPTPKVDPKTGQRYLSRNTSNQALRAAELVELLLCLDRIGLQGRLFTHRIEAHIGRREISLRSAS